MDTSMLASLDTALNLVSDIEVTQWTGHFDRNGKMIFDGDVVKADWCWDEPHIIDWPHDEYNFVEFGLNMANIEIVGNIYETPEPGV